MGLMTLEDFRTDLNSALGNRGITNTRLDRWINFAYLDVTGAVDFEVCDDEDTTQSTTVGNNYVNVPTGASVVKLVRNTTDDALLTWVPKAEYWRLSQSSGVAIKWTRHNTKILLNPVPNGVKSLRIVYKKPVTILSATSDSTVIPADWDAAVFMLSVHHGLLGVGEEQRAMVWFQRAVNYVQSRLTEERIQMTTGGLGLSIPQVTTPAGAVASGA